jgi:hypothetical protein
MAKVFQAVSPSPSSLSLSATDRPFALRSQADDDDSDAQSEASEAVSEVSIDSYKKPAAPPLIQPPQPKPKAPAAPAPPPQPATAARRGSLLTDPTVDTLLNNAKNKAASDSDESDNDEEWD